MVIVSDKIYVNVDLLGRNITGFCEQFTYSNPLYFKQKRMGFSVAKIPRTITNYSWTTIENKKYLVIPRGAMNKLKSFMLVNGIPTVRPTDKRVCKNNIDFNVNDNIVMNDGQIKIINELSNNGYGGLIQCGAGGGKSIACMGVIAKVKQPTLIVVHTSALQKQWLSVLKEKTNGSYSLGRLDGTKKVDGDVVVAIIDSLYAKCFKDIDNPDFSYLSNFGMIIADECHTCSSRTFKDVLDNASCKYKIGVTATATRKDGLHFLFYDSLGEILVDIKDSELKDRITDFNFKQIDTNIEFMIPNRTSYVGKGQKLTNMDFNKFIEIITTSEKRNKLIIDNVVSDIKLGHTVLVLTHRVEHAKLLYSMLKELYMGYLIIGENSKDVNLDEIKLDKTFKFIVANREIASEGLDIPQLSALHLVIPSSNFQKIKQQIGRIRRYCEGKLTPMLTDYVDNMAYIVTDKDGTVEKSPIFKFTAKKRLAYYIKSKKEYSE